MDILFLQAIDNLDMVKIDDHTASRSTGYVCDLVSLHGYLHVFKRGYHRQLYMIAWFSYCVQEGSTSEVNADVTLFYSVESIQTNKYRESQGDYKTKTLETHTCQSIDDIMLKI